MGGFAQKARSFFRPGLFFHGAEQVLLLLAICIHGRGHASDDLPRPVRSSPRVRNPQSVRPNFGACAVRPRCVNSIVIGRDVARYLNRELLDRGRLELDPFGRVRGNPVGDVILSHGCGTDKWPANKILVPQPAILLQVVSFHIFPVGFFQFPDLRFVLR